jgi:hypothetical protein
LLITVAILAFLGNVIMLGWATTAWHSLTLVAGIALLVLIYPRHPRSEWNLIWRDPQQRQHSLIAIAIILAGAAQLIAANTGLLFLSYLWPLALVFIGILFMIHTQHGHSDARHQALFRHRILGITIITAGLLSLAEILLQSKTFAILWSLALLIAAVQLLLYREPEGAFDEDHLH